MNEIKKQMLDQIAFFHAYYAKTKHPEALEIAQNLGKAIKKTDLDPKLEESLSRIATP